MDTDLDAAPTISDASEVVGRGPVATVYCDDGATAVKVFDTGRGPDAEVPPPHAAIAAEIGRGTLAERDGARYVSSRRAARSLAGLVEDTSKRSWHETTGLGVHLAGALEAAHTTGIVHGGVKPTNILMVDVGTEDAGAAAARLADFGHGAWRVARSGAGIDIGFYPPEVLEGAEPDACADVYGLGATLLYALTGTAPFEALGDEPATRRLRRILSDDIPDVRPLRVPDDLAGVIEKAMAKDPGDRFESAAALGEALRDVQREHGHTVTPLDTGAAGATAPAAVDVTTPELTTTPPPPAKSSVRAWALGALVVAALAAVGVVVAIALSTEAPEPGDSVAGTLAPPTAASTPPTTAQPVPGADPARAGAGPAGADTGADASVFVDVDGYELTDVAADSVMSDPALAASIFQKANVATVRSGDGRDVGIFVVLVLQEAIADDPETLIKILTALAPDPPQPAEEVTIGGQPMVVTSTPDGQTLIAAQDPTGMIVGLLRGSDRASMEAFMTALGRTAQR